MEISYEDSVRAAHNQLKDHFSISGFRDRMKNTKNEWLLDAMTIIIEDQEKRIKALEAKN